MCETKMKGGKKRDIFEHFRGDVPKEETPAEISQGILVCAGARSEDYLGKV